ncbi:uncharacterized protein LOC123258953 [Cotesia glomerata]|uniref:uncharacterized protein LOC123258953 n=1 Tax=Cotesia glomerata TaxID=32391 RepID=UPI001D00340E|nr:uncharacterized protein LOC123258953 [Cotesia glomerata]
MENSWEDASDEFFLNAYDAFVCESINNIDNDSFDCGVSDSQIMVGAHGWTHRVLECPLVTSTQIIPGEKSFTSALTLAEEFIREDTVRALPTNLDDYLKETAVNIVSTINNNYSEEQKININPFIMEYEHQGNYQNFDDNCNIFEFVINCFFFFYFSGQGGLSEFILEKSSELIYSILEAFFIRGIDLSETQEISDLDAEATEENSAITSIPIVTLGEEEETSVITPVPVLTLEDESKDIFDLSLEDGETKEKGTTPLSQEMNRVIKEIVKFRGKKKEDRK